MYQTANNLPAVHNKNSIKMIIHALGVFQTYFKAHAIIWLIPMHMMDSNTIVNAACSLTTVYIFIAIRIVARYKKEGIYSNILF